MKLLLLILLAFQSMKMVAQVHAGSISASLDVADQTLGQVTDYQFTITAMDTQLTDKYSYFIFEFDATLGVTIPSAPSCTGGTGFTQSAVSCTNDSATQIRLICHFCDFTSHPNYQITLNGLTNPYYALTQSVSVTISTYDVNGNLLDQTSDSSI